MNLIQHFWYRIHVERQTETVTVLMLTSQMTPLKTILEWRLLFSEKLAGVFDFSILQDKHNIRTINLHSLPNRQEKRLTQGSLFYLFLKHVLINYIFSGPTMYVYCIFSSRLIFFGALWSMFSETETDVWTDDMEHYRRQRPSWSWSYGS